MAWLLNLATKARKVPVAGWMLAALVFLFILCLHFMRRAKILSQRLVVERQINVSKRRHEKVMTGQDDRLKSIKFDLDEMRTGKISELEDREFKIRKKAFNMKTTAELINEVFNK